MIQQMKSEEKFQEWLDYLNASEEYALARRSGLYIARPDAKLLAKEEQFISGFAEKWIPGVRWSSRAYSAYLNILRMEVFNDFSQKMQYNGMDLESADGKRAMKDISKFINNATGRGNIGEIGVNGEAALNAVFFAPRYVASRFNVLGNTLTGYAFYHPAVRKEALKTVLAYTATVMTILTLAALAGAEVEDDPRSSDFGKIRIGGMVFDLGAGFLQPIVLLARTISGKKKKLSDGKVVDINTGAYKGETRYDIWQRFLRTKLSPSTSLVVDWANAPKDKRKKVEVPFTDISFEDQVYFQNVIGEDLTSGEKLANMILPLYLQDMAEITKEEGLGMALGSSIPALFGVGSSYYIPDNKKTSKGFDETETILDGIEFTNEDFLDMDEGLIEVDDLELEELE